MNLQFGKRTLLMAAGFFIMTFGVALSTKADLGTTPVSCIPYVLSLASPFTMGTWTFIMNVLFVIIQYLLLKNEFQHYQWSQIPVIFVFSAFIDINMYLVSGLLISGYLMQWIFCLLSFVFIAVGISLLLKANMIMMAGEALVLVISHVLHAEYGRIKIYFDSVMVLGAVILSFSLMGGLLGVREGTIAAALCVGMIVRHIMRLPGFSGKKHEK